MSISIATIRFSGGLDISRYPEVARTLTLIPEDDGVVVDLSKAEWVDSSFLMELLLFHRRLQQTGRRVIVVARGNVARSLLIAGFDKRMRILPEYDEAVRALRTFGRGDRWPGATREELADTET